MTTCSKCGGKLLEAGELPDGVCGHNPGCPDGLVCVHGSLRRSCETCERDARIAELERQLADATAAWKDLMGVQSLQQRLGYQGRELNEARGQCEKWRTRSVNAERQLGDAGQQYAALYNAKRRAEEELSQEKDRNATLEREHGVSETMLKNQQQRNQSLDWHLTEVVKENEFLGGPLWAKNPTVDGLRKELAEARAEMERVEGMVEGLRQICLEAGVSLAIIDAALRGETGQ